MNIIIDRSDEPQDERVEVALAAGAPVDLVLLGRSRRRSSTGSTPPARRRRSRSAAPRRRGGPSTPGSTSSSPRAGRPAATSGARCRPSRSCPRSSMPCRDTPVVAAGGITDGRGLAAVLALGAGAAWMGTRFVASEEAPAHPRWKARLIGAARDGHLLLEPVRRRLAGRAAPDAAQRDDRRLARGRLAADRASARARARSSRPGPTGPRSSATRPSPRARPLDRPDRRPLALVRPGRRAWSRRSCRQRRSSAAPWRTPSGSSRDARRLTWSATRPGRRPRRGRRGRARPPPRARARAGRGRSRRP